jgi:hypothetical protein
MLLYTALKTGRGRFIYTSRKDKLVNRYSLTVNWQFSLAGLGDQEQLIGRFCCSLANFANLRRKTIVDSSIPDRRQAMDLFKVSHEMAFIMHADLSHYLFYAEERGL